MTRNQAALITVGFLAIQIASFSTGAEAEIIVGVKAGPSFATQSTGNDLAPEVTWSTRTGLAVGADLEFPLNDRIWLRAEPMYVQKGTEVDWPPEFPLDNVQKYDYFSIPLNLKVILSSGGFRPFVFLGPDIAFTLSSKTQMKQDGTQLDIDSKALELGLDFGTGTDISLGSLVGVTLDVRYSLGLTNIDSRPGLSEKNRAVLVLAGLFVRL